MSGLTNVPHARVKFEGGFWAHWQETAARVTAHSLFDQFVNTGRIEAMRIRWKPGMPQKPHIFWDSDVAKWMEAAAYILCDHDDPALREKLETVIGLIEAAQAEDGYYNAYFLCCEPPEARFTDRTAHELYTAGHLIEAAVAHYEATGSSRFLNIMRRFADLIERVFVTEKTSRFKATGHEELELALFRLYRATNEPRYLALSKHFLDVRGTDPGDRVFSVPNGTPPADPPLRCHVQYDASYAQDDAPVRELPEVLGHAVRAMYLLAAMADVALETGDEALARACRRLWDDSTERKMYVTGGVSGERFGEAVGPAYSLPNLTSYAETCASVSMAQFAQRMFLLDRHARYADNVELQMYNGALVGLSMDGTAFFYDNALESRPALVDFLHGVNVHYALPPYRRLKVFDCSCCPPNILRFVASVGRYFYSAADDALFVHQYAGGSAELSLRGGPVRVFQTTNYPLDGEVRLRVEAEGAGEITLALRMPGWCAQPSAHINGHALLQDGVPARGARLENGYLYIKGCFGARDEIVLEFPMPVVEMEANPLVADACGKVALKRGPLVFCLERADNDANLFDLTLPRDARYRLDTQQIGDMRLPVIRAKATTRAWDGGLYSPRASGRESHDITAIPYFAWANREPGDMVVWLKKE